MAVYADVGAQFTSTEPSTFDIIWRIITDKTYFETDLNLFENLTIIPHEILSFILQLNILYQIVMLFLLSIAWGFLFLWLRYAKLKHKNKKAIKKQS